jgi:arylsulfatase A-like enzyme
VVRRGVVADHGEAFGEHGAWGHSQNLFREVLDIPLLIRPPGGKGGGRRVSEPVSLIDILPTLRDVAGLPPDPRCEGMSLLPLLKDGAEGAGERPLLAHLVRKDRAGRVTRSVIHDGWKAIREWPGRRMLFRIDEDRAEERDRSSDLASLADSLETRLLTLERSARTFTQETTRLEVGSETVEALKALGYVQ